MKKDVMRQLVSLLPGRDAQIGIRLIQERRFEDLKEIVDSDITKYEQVEDSTGEIEKRLVGLYDLSDGLNDYILTIDDTEYEEI